MKKFSVIIGLFALTLFYFSDVLSGRLLLVERDLTSFFYPFRFIWIETARQGHFPFWNPYIKCGVPLFATIQPAVLYPLSLPYLFLPVDLAFNWTIVFHFFLAGAFTYALMRELGASLQGALAGACCFLFGGYLISVHNVLNTLLSVSWYPLVILCGYRMFTGGKAWWAAASGASLCCMFLAGGMEIVIFALASLMFLFLYPRLLPGCKPVKGVGFQRRLGFLGLALVIFLGLSMVQLLPSLELYRLSDRSGGMTLEMATHWSLAPEDLFYFLIPELYGSRVYAEQYWRFQNYLKTIYVGPICLLLSGIYFLREGRRGIPLVAAMGLVLVLALGRFTPLYPLLFKYLPFFDTFRYPVKFLFIFTFWLCVTAGMGLDVVRRRFLDDHPPNPRYQGLLVGTALVLTGFLVLGRFFPERVTSLALDWFGHVLEPSSIAITLRNWNRLLVLMILTLTVILFGLRGKLTRFGSPLLLTLLIFDLFFGNRGFAQKLDAASFHAETPMIRTLKSDDSLFRFHVALAERDLKLFWPDYKYFHLRRKDALGYNLMMEHHLFDIDGYNVPLQPRYERLIGLIRGQPLASMRNLLDMLNVKYVLSESPVDIPGFGLVRGGGDTNKLYRNKNQMPRAFLVKNFEVLEDEQEFARAFHDSNFDPRETVLLETVPHHLLALREEPANPAISRTVKLVKYENNRLLLTVNTPEAAILFMSETHYPGWKAYVDGREEEVLRANYAFRAIIVGPGAHHVEVIYQPLSFKVGLAVSLLTIFLLQAGWIIRVRREGRKMWG